MKTSTNVEFYCMSNVKWALKLTCFSLSADVHLEPPASRLLGIRAGICLSPTYEPCSPTLSETQHPNRGSTEQLQTNLAGPAISPKDAPFFSKSAAQVETPA